MPIVAARVVELENSIAIESYSAKMNKRNFAQNNYKIHNDINITLANMKLNRISFHCVNVC